MKKIHAFLLSISMPYNIVIIAAGGQGNRIGSTLPKQYHVLVDKPVLMHTISAFHGIANKIIVVIHEQMIPQWQSLCKEYDFKIKHEIVVGGKTRFESIQKGLRHIQDIHSDLVDENTAIAVHDAARPLITPQLIQKSFLLCQEGKGNILGIQSINSIRVGTPGSSKALDRDKVWIIQTPQTFPATVLMKAFAQEEQSHFTDEASVVEHLGYPISILQGDPKNLKITYPEDFTIAQMYLNKKT